MVYVIISSFDNSTALYRFRQGSGKVVKLNILVVKRSTNSKKQNLSGINNIKKFINTKEINILSN